LQPTPNVLDKRPYTLYTHYRRYTDQKGNSRTRGSIVYDLSADLQENQTILREVPPVSEHEGAPFELSTESDGAHEGIVLKVYSGVYIVHADADQDCHLRKMECILRGNLKKDFTYSTSTSQPIRVTRAKRPFSKDVIAVGDRVRFTAIDSTNGIIEEVLPRRTRFARSSFRGREQTLVTNLDQLVIVFACAEPNPDLWRIDRWLVAAESNGWSR